jgi:hypothetical protein
MDTLGIQNTSVNFFGVLIDRFGFLRISIVVPFLCPGFTMKSVCLSVVFVVVVCLPYLPPLPRRIVTMDIGCNINYYDADDDEVIAGVHEDDDAEIQYGYCRSRRRTSYEYRGSSLLTPAQIMEQEAYYRYAEVAVQRVTYILQLILLHQASYVTLRATLGQWSGIDSMTSAIAFAREKMR